MHSMTGFGKAEIFDGRYRFSVEVKTVNHRYLEIGIKLPKTLSRLESLVRSRLKEYLERGKVDIYISFEDMGGGTECVRYNSALAHEYAKFLLQMSKEFGLDNDMRISTLARFPDVFTTEDAEIDVSELKDGLLKCLNDALSQVAEMRRQEGEALKKDMLMKLSEMEKMVSFINDRSPAVVEEYRARLREKIEALLQDKDLDESRLLTEVAIFADKCSVDEEIVRLRSHIEAFKRELEKSGSVGRKLDFLAQEMNREANTTLSKVTDLSLADMAIEIKTCIEKLREQVQNIE